jgi:hypothetical protein
LFTLPNPIFCRKMVLFKASASALLLASDKHCGPRTVERGEDYKGLPG